MNLKYFLLQIMWLVTVSSAFGQVEKLANGSIKYSFTGKAVFNGSTQGYRLDVVDDGSGIIKGENISIVENGRKIIGLVNGKINYSAKKIYFKELKVLNLRPGETQNDYCFFEINVDFISKEDKTYCVGNFIGYSPNGSECGRGKIYLTANKNVEVIRKNYLVKKDKEKQEVIAKQKEQKEKEAAKKIEQDKKRQEQLERKKELAKAEQAKRALQLQLQQERQKKEDSILVSLKQQNIESNIPKNLPFVPLPTYEYDSDTLLITITDYDQDDGDKVTMLLNDVPLYSEHILTNKVDSILLNMNGNGKTKGEDTISFYAHNEGYLPPNSGVVKIYERDKVYTYYVNNKYNQKRHLILRKRKNTSQ
jgi:hypothetical protein